MIRLDNAGLLFWLRYHDNASIKKLEVYEKLEVDQPIYKEFRENTALATKLKTLLEIDELVRAMEERVIDFTGPFKWISSLKFRSNGYKAQVQLVKDLREERKKAHDAYEMLRKLTYTSNEGYLFAVEFTDRKII